MGGMGDLDGLIVGWDVEQLKGLLRVGVPNNWMVLLRAGLAGWLRVCRRPAAETSGAAPAKAGGGNRAPQPASRPSPI